MHIRSAMFFPALSLTLAISGCAGPDTAALEQEQRALQGEVERLSAQLQVLRQEMTDAGLTPPDPQAQPAPGKAKVKARGKAKSKAKAKARNLERIRQEHGEAAPNVGHWAPRQDLTRTQDAAARVQLTVRRIGDPPALPSPPSPERTDSPCGLKILMPELQPLSDWPLNAAGYGKSGPVLILQDGKALQPHAGPEHFADQCGGAFRHAGNHFLFSPSDSIERAEPHDFRLALDPQVPIKRGDDGREMYWVYPGTTLEISLDKGWPEGWGPLDLDLAGRIATPASAPATLQSGEWSRPLPLGSSFEDFRLTERLPPTDGPWTLQIASPADGPYILLHALTLGNAERAVVFTSEDAFRKEAGP